MTGVALTSSASASTASAIAASTATSSAPAVHTVDKGLLVANITHGLLVPKQRVCCAITLVTVESLSHNPARSPRSAGILALHLS
jgi:hypothetical protein